jgi:hypothetical protein
MSKYDAMVKATAEARDQLERLESELEQRAEAAAARDFDPDIDVKPLNDELAGTAVRALQDVFEIVKQIADDGWIEMPNQPLSFGDAVLVTILVNAELAYRHMERDLKWMAGVIERTRQTVKEN